jgi:hypothetical protein
VALGRRGGKERPDASRGTISGQTAAVKKNAIGCRKTEGVLVFSNCCSEVAARKRSIEDGEKGHERLAFLATYRGENFLFESAVTH